MEAPGGLRPTRAQLGWGGAAALSYAVGYPLALAAASPVGWVLVMLGGLFLLGLVGSTVRRVHRSDAPPSGASVRSP